MNQVNQVDKIQTKDESQFRVHFYLKNVFYSCEKRLPVFLEQTAAAISQVVPVSIIQVFGAITKLVDLSIGLKTEEYAASFFESKKKIYLIGENKLLTEHQPIFSQSFKIFYNHYKTLNPSVKEISPQKTESKLQILTSPKVQLRSPQKNQLKESSSSKRLEPTIYHSILYILGIPLEFKDRDIIYLLSQYKIRVRYAEWKMREDMEYLFAELQEPVSEALLFSSEIYIEKYPIIIGVKSSDQTISDLVLKHQIEVNFDKEINEIEFMKMANRVGGVMAMIKDEYYGPRRYVVCFNKPQKTTLFNEQLEKGYKNMKISKPKYPVRISRLEKPFTFTTMMQNLAIHEMQLKKMQISSSLMTTNDQS